MLFMPDIDLFASRVNAYLGLYLGNLTLCIFNVFSVSWEKFIPYIFPPFSLLGKVLTKIQQNKVFKAIVIAPCWATCPWYPTLLSMFILTPILLPRQQDLLTINDTQLHPLRTTLVLAAWPVSGVNFQVLDFLRGQPSLSSTHGDPAQINSTHRPGRYSLAGVVQGHLIHFRHLTGPMSEHFPDFIVGILILIPLLPWFCRYDYYLLLLNVYYLQCCCALNMRNESRSVRHGTKENENYAKVLTCSIIEILRVPC